MWTIADALRANVRRVPERVAVVDAGSRRTWRELAGRAGGIAGALHGQGIGRGDAVALLSRNSVFFCEAYLGAVAAGAMCVPLNWRHADPELAFTVNDCGATVLFVEAPYVATVERLVGAGAVPEGVRVVTEGAEFERLAGGDPVWPAVGEHDPNVVLYTGGTTGFPKGVVLTHRNVLANALDEIVDTDMCHDDVTLLITPMFHSASLCCWFLPHVLLGATSVLVRGFDIDEVVATVAAERVTNGFLVPSMVRALLRSGKMGPDAFQAYRRLYTGGATFELGDKRAVADALPGVAIYYQYGLTEAAPIVTRLRPEDMFREDIDGTIGQEILLNEVRIVDDDGHPVPDGTVGEIVVRGPNVMQGYLGRPDATAEVLRNGWLHTGDLASRNAEGFFFFKDRRKDMIKSGGENVYSAEVEQVLYLHADVAEAAVFGVPSDQWDEEVLAVVALKPGRSLDADALRAFCRPHLAAYKIPKQVRFVEIDDIPMNPSGKILKRELRDRILS